MHISLVLAPGVPILTFALLREVVSLANAQAGAPVFSMDTRTVTAAPITSFDGFEIAPDRSDWTPAPGWDLVVLCAGAKPLGCLPMGLRGFLTRAAQAGGTLAGFDGGATILASLGYLDGFQAALPAPTSDEQAKAQAQIIPAKHSFCLDRQRLTATTGIAACDAVLAWIAQVHSPELAREVSEKLSLKRSAPKPPAQQIPKVEDPVLAQMQTLMAAHLAAPLPLNALAGEMGLSQKQLRLRCRKGLGQTPTQIYLNLRLNRAEQLVRDTVLTVEEIAHATGFASPSAFTRSFRTRFGAPPRLIRKTAPEIRGRPN